MYSPINAQDFGRLTGMRELSKKEFCDVQIEVMEKFHNFCKLRGLRYTLGCGTLIGAVRHKGFIPWDDDVDLYMPRNDYQKAIDLLFSEPEPGLRLCAYTLDSKYPYPFIKLSDTRTKLVENGYDYDIGVYIDIFPIDALPTGFLGGLKTKVAFAFARLMRLAGNLKSREYYAGKSLKSRVKSGLFRLFLFVFPRAFLFRVYDKLALSAWNNGSEKVCDILWGNGIAGAFDRAGIESFVEMEFEGRKFDVMSGYAQYLANTYGDYMTPPPPEARVSVHDFKAYWRN